MPICRNAALPGPFPGRARLYDDTSHTRYKFYRSNSGAKKWGNDALGNTTLANGAAVAPNFANDDKYCMSEWCRTTNDSNLQARFGRARSGAQTGLYRPRETCNLSPHVSHG